MFPIKRRIQELNTDANDANDVAKEHRRVFMLRIYAPPALRAFSPQVGENFKKSVVYLVFSVCKRQKELCSFYSLLTIIYSQANNQNYQLTTKKSIYHFEINSNPLLNNSRQASTISLLYRIPEFFFISSKATSIPRAGLYGLCELIASTTSATAIIFEPK